MFYVSLLQGCVNLIFGEDENFNARLNHKFAFNPIRRKRGNNCPSNFLLSTVLSTMTLQYQDFMTFPKNYSIYI